VRSWEPLEGELRGQGKAWRAFKTFRDMPQRSLRGAAALFYGRSEEGPTRSQYDQFKRWSAKFAWRERVHSHDAWIEMVQRSAIEEHAQAKAAEHARRETALREKSLEARELALEQSIKMLKWPLVEQRAVETDESGNPVTMVFLPAGWSKATIPGLFRMAEGRGDTPEEADPADLLDFSKLTEEELYAFRDLLQAATEDPDRKRGPGAGQ
jgi:hypothetical protein